jgi:hypothetical protein
LSKFIDAPQDFFTFCAHWQDHLNNFLVGHCIYQGHYAMLTSMVVACSVASSNFLVPKLLYNHEGRPMDEYFQNFSKPTFKIA